MNINEIYHFRYDMGDLENWDFDLLIELINSIWLIYIFINHRKFDLLIKELKGNH